MTAEVAFQLSVTARAQGCDQVASGPPHRAQQEQACVRRDPNIARDQPDRAIEMRLKWALLRFTLGGICQRVVGFAAHSMKHGESRNIFIWLKPIGA